MLLDPLINLTIFNFMKNVINGPRGKICLDLPSPYEAHPCGLLYLPRFIAKIRKHLKEGLPDSYLKNFKRGFDQFLCMHLGIDPEHVIEAVKKAGEDDLVLDGLLGEIFPENLEVRKWNHEITHKGQTEAGRAFIKESLEQMGVPYLQEKIVCIMDMIDLDEGRIPGFCDNRRKEWEDSLKNP
tara:strand:+ start:1917 stop:2465 length:549 start_codon:yes stop_codon:yes gene_type:complete